MTQHHARALARRYHDAWTSANYDEAIDLLSQTVAVEVPLNDYPTRESFGDALRRFGSLVWSVELLSEMARDNEVMLLYDMEVDQLGRLRVAEHFTVAGGKIARLRQVHDTAPIRAWLEGPVSNARA